MWQNDIVQVLSVIRFLQAIDDRPALEGDATVTLPVGSSYVDPGYTARDNYEGDISDKVEVRGGVDWETMG